MHANGTVTSLVAGQRYARQSTSGFPHEGSKCASLPLSKCATCLMCSSHRPRVCALLISHSIQIKTFHNPRVRKPACPRSHQSLFLSSQTPLTNHTCDRSPALCSSPKPLTIHQPLLCALCPMRSISSPSGVWLACTKPGKVRLLLLGQLLTSRPSIVLRECDFASCQPLKVGLSAHLLWF